MWGVGLTMCIMGCLALLADQKLKGAVFWFAFIVTGLVAMWVGS